MISMQENPKKNKNPQREGLVFLEMTGVRWFMNTRAASRGEMGGLVVAGGYVVRWVLVDRECCNDRFFACELSLSILVDSTRQPIISKQSCSKTPIKPHQTIGQHVHSSHFNKHAHTHTLSQRLTQ